MQMRGIMTERWKAISLEHNGSLETWSYSNGITEDTVSRRSTIMRGSAKRKEMVGSERSGRDRKQLDFGVACRAGNTSRFCKPGEKEREKKSLSLSLATRRLHRCFADEEKKDRVAREKRERKRERLESKRAFITGRTSWHVLQAYRR